jgi:hypothetical protein
MGENKTPNRCYLLFAASQRPPRGGLGDLVDTFSSEETARRAFRDLRLKDSSVTSWAQLAVVDGDKGIQPLCWFGIGATPTRAGRRSTSRTPGGRTSRFSLRRTA